MTKKHPVLETPQFPQCWPDRLWTRDDGALIPIRRLSSHSARRALVEVFEAMSPESRYFRYLAPMPRLSRATLQQLSDVDPQRHLAWAAVADGVSVGLARVVLDDDGVAELAVEVADSHMRMGVGRRLVSEALAGAAGWGVDRVELLVHPLNEKAAAFFRTLGAELGLDQGLLVGSLPVPSRVAAVA